MWDQNLPARHVASSGLPSKFRLDSSFARVDPPVHRYPPPSGGWVGPPRQKGKGTLHLQGGGWVPPGCRLGKRLHVPPPRGGAMGWSPLHPGSPGPVPSIGRQQLSRAILHEPYPGDLTRVSGTRQVTYLSRPRSPTCAGIG